MDEQSGYMKQRGSERPPFMSGRLDDVALPELVQMLASGGHTSRIELTATDGRRGSVTIEKGTVGRCRFGDLMAEDAFYALCRIGGRFAVYRTDPEALQRSTVARGWQELLLEAARWPVVLSAVVNVLLRVKRPYMITPKGRPPGALPPGGRLYGPFLGLAWVGLAAIGVFVAQGGTNPAAGHLVLVFLNVATLVALVAATVALETRDAREHVGTAVVLRGRAGTLAALAVTGLATSAALVAAWAPMTGAIG